MKIGDKVRCIKWDANLEIGKVYTIYNSSIICNKNIITLVENGCGYYADYFEVVMSIENKIALAKSFIGKSVIGGMTKRLYIPNRIDIVTSLDDAKRLKVSSDVVKNQFKMDDIVVVLSDDYLSFPVEMVKLAPESKTVKLNENYEANVYQDKIVVGCQTFPISILEELKNTHSSLIEH